jgi:hypothetical protein
VPKKEPANIFLYLTACAFLGLRAKTPNVHGSVATKYEIINMSCQSWSSVDVTYVQPPQVRVRKMPTPAINFGSVAFGRRVRMYQSVTRANRGPDLSLAESKERKSMPRTGRQCNEEHENGPFRISVANCSRNGRKPFLWIALDCFCW